MRKTPEERKLEEELDLRIDLINISSLMMMSIKFLHEVDREQSPLMYEDIKRQVKDLRNKEMLLIDKLIKVNDYTAKRDYLKANFTVMNDLIDDGILDYDENINELIECAEVLKNTYNTPAYYRMLDEEEINRKKEQDEIELKIKVNIGG